MNVRYSLTRAAMVPVSNVVTFPRLPASVGVRPVGSRTVFRAIAIMTFVVGVTAILLVLAGCTSTQQSPEARTATEAPESPVERVAAKTARQATGMAGGAASRAVRVTGQPYVDSLLSGAVRNSASELQRWWSAKP